MIQQQKRSTSIFFRDSMHRNRYMQLYIKETDMAKDSLFGNIFNSANLNDQCNRMKQTNKVVFCAPCTLKSVYVVVNFLSQEIFIFPLFRLH